MMVRLMYREEVILITPYELLELIRENYTDEETVQIINEILYELHINLKRFIKGLEEEKDEFALQKNICPLCSNSLVTKSHEEDRGEFQGFNCTETMYKVECSSPECSYTST